MTHESPPDEPQAGEPGVFGNLPSARPGVRSPRRESGKKKGAAEATPKAKEPKRASGASARPAPKQPAARPSPPPASPPPPRRPAPPAAEEGAERGGGVEDLAWAGVTVAAEAATLGVRLVSRALEAVRERR